MLTLEQVRKKLKDKNLSAFSRRCGVTRVTLCKIRHGYKRVNLGTLQKISDALTDGDPIECECARKCRGCK